MTKCCSTNSLLHLQHGSHLSHFSDDALFSQLHFPQWILRTPAYRKSSPDVEVHVSVTSYTIQWIKLFSFFFSIPSDINCCCMKRVRTLSHRAQEVLIQEDEPRWHQAQLRRAPFACSPAPFWLSYHDKRLIIIGQIRNAFHNREPPLLAAPMQSTGCR